MEHHPRAAVPACRLRRAMRRGKRVLLRILMELVVPQVFLQIIARGVHRVGELLKEEPAFPSIIAVILPWDAAILLLQRLEVHAAMV